jgi:nucleotide-binding universal stress UspA family protein
MSGIYVGIDGSSHSQVALEWAMREAGIRHEPLTVIAVQEVPASGWGGLVVYPHPRMPACSWSVPGVSGASPGC